MSTLGNKLYDNSERKNGDNYMKLKQTSTLDKNSFSWPLMKDCVTEEDKSSMIKFIQTTEKFTNGPKVKEFEEEWSKWLGVKHSLFVSSGSAANLLLMAGIKEHYNLNDGDKVVRIRFQSSPLVIVIDLSKGLGSVNSFWTVI